MGSCLSCTLLHMPYYLKKGLPDHLAYFQSAYHFYFLLFISTRYLLPNTSSKSFSVFFYLMSAILVSKKNNSIKLCCQNNNNNKKIKWRSSLFFFSQKCSVTKRYFLISRSISSQNKPPLSILVSHKTLPSCSPVCSHEQSIMKSA